MKHRTSLALKALGELGLRQMSLYALYRLQLHSGYLRRQASDDRRFTNLPDACFRLFPLMELPDPDHLRSILGGAGCGALLSEADEILVGRVRLFGGEPVPLELVNSGPKLHWTELEKSSNEIQEKDIKWTWEAGRFGWAIVLGRAYWLSGDERYPESFWKYLETFLDANPAYQGAQWTSAQEAALRLIAIVFAAQTFAGSPHSTPARMVSLGQAIAAHAGRIPPSKAYSQAQNNNHLLSEAAGLYTAGLALMEHPQAANWRKLGWRWFHQGLASQVSADGSYAQHSTNYHRLMLQLALWVARISEGQPFPTKTSDRLAAATRWLLDLLDDESGGVPNLGPNDGAYILPLSAGSVWDFRPVVQAAGKAFLGKAPLAAGNWDEMGLWLSGISPLEDTAGSGESSVKTVRLDHSWAYLRTARFSSRPGHADQLHVDLWWRGVNLALDPGTYLYNAAPPWDNALSRTCVHNTVTVNDQEQMTRAGRFLWLDWAQARLLEHEKAPDGAWERISAEHDGYRRLGVVHRRSMTGFKGGRWWVKDTLYTQENPENSSEFSIRLYWLLPDWPWMLQKIDYGANLLLQSPNGWVMLKVEYRKEALALLAEHPQICLVRAGEMEYGEGAANPILGWRSLTYAYKKPALSLSFAVKTSLPIDLLSRWYLLSEVG